MGAVDVKVDGGLFKGIGDGISGIINAIKGQVPPEKAAEIELEAQKLQNQILVAQAEINKAEASSTNWFVAGWRPAVGWVCVAGLAFQFVLRPFIQWGLAIASRADLAASLPALAVEQLMSLLFGMLGLAITRTVEKSSGSARS